MARINRPVRDIVKTAHTYLFNRAQASSATSVKNRESPVLKKWIAANGVEDETSGHINWVFDEPLTIGGETIKGLRNECKRGTPQLDEEAAQKLVTDKGLRERVVSEITVEVWDYDELYTLNQQELITDDELDALYPPTDPTYSLVVIK